jgi:uncharacterized hydrophobic protein (TIGR00271 family)
MSEYVQTAVLVTQSLDNKLYQKITENVYGVTITSVEWQDFKHSPSQWLTEDQHVIACLPEGELRDLLALSQANKFSLGLLPDSKNSHYFDLLKLPKDFDSALDLALKANDCQIDLVRCNGKIMLRNAIVGWMPVLDRPASMSRWHMIFDAIGRYRKMRMLRFSVRTESGKEIETAASGCMVLQRSKNDFLQRLSGDSGNTQDSMAGLILVSPFSILLYLTFLIQVYLTNSNGRRLPDGVGYIQSNRIEISTPGNKPLKVKVDDDIELETPLVVEVESAAISVNVPEESKANPTINPKESVKTHNLPDDKEARRYIEKGIPLFPFASEERFRDLFPALMEDAEIDSTFIILMLLSTSLASVGFYLNSSAVIIGAMILAPLMAPMVSLSMGLLRGNMQMFQTSMKKIGIGIILALTASALLSKLFIFQPVTPEMLARVQPSLPDLFVAILSGIAAAYAKAHREMIQNLAGVAIAVALVPPLAVAGIGIGRGDMVFFQQAFLLFTTNLLGISLAATFTFRVLGYSPSVKNRSGLFAGLLLTGILCIPLYLTYQQIADHNDFETQVKTDRFLVDGVYVAVVNAKMLRRDDRVFLDLEVVANEPLNHRRLRLLKEKLQKQFDKELTVRATVSYRL